MPSSFSFPHIWRSAIVLLALVMNLVLAYRLLWGEQSYYAWQNMKERRTELQAELEGLDVRRATLSKEIRLLQTDFSYVEKVIRSRLNYVRPDEILYVFDEIRPEDTHWTLSTEGTHE